MTLLISAIGLIGRFAGALLTTSLGWASTLLFGRVRSSHQIFVVSMLGGALLWMFLLIAALAPGLPNFVLDITPHPSFVGRTLIRAAVLIGLAIVPLAVGVAAYLVPADGERATGLRAGVEWLRGYLLTPILAVLMLFLPAVGISRKARSLRHRWSDTHIPIVVKPDGYDRLVHDLRHALERSGLRAQATAAPAVLSLPAFVLAAVAGSNVRSLRPDRLIELDAPDLRIGIYPSDIAISGPDTERRSARAAIIRCLASAAAHLTTSSEAQAVEDRLDALLRRGSGEAGPDPVEVRAAFAAIDGDMAELPIDPDEWDILYRIRLQTERDILVGEVHGPVPPAAPVPAGAGAPDREPAPVAGGLEASHSR